MYAYIGIRIPQSKADLVQMQISDFLGGFFFLGGLSIDSYFNIMLGEIKLTSRALESDSNGENAMQRAVMVIIVHFLAHLAPTFPTLVVKSLNLEPIQVLGRSPCGGAVRPPPNGNLRAC